MRATVSAFAGTALALGAGELEQSRPKTCGMTRGMKLQQASGFSELLNMTQKYSKSRCASLHSVKSCTTQGRGAQHQQFPFGRIATLRDRWYGGATGTFHQHFAVCPQPQLTHPLQNTHERAYSSRRTFILFEPHELMKRCLFIKHRERRTSAPLDSLNQS